MNRRHQGGVVSEQRRTHHGHQGFMEMDDFGFGDCISGAANSKR
jgi:hypothetical protein